MTVPFVDAGRPFGPKPIEAVGVIDAPDDALVAEIALGVMASEKVPPTGVLADTSHASERVADVPLLKMSGDESENVCVPPLGISGFDMYNPFTIA